MRGRRRGPSRLPPGREQPPAPRARRLSAVPSPLAAAAAAGCAAGAGRGLSGRGSPAAPAGRPRALPGLRRRRRAEPARGGTVASAACCRPGPRRRRARGGGGGGRRLLPAAGAGAAALARRGRDIAGPGASSPLLSSPPHGRELLAELALVGAAAAGWAWGGEGAAGGRRALSIHCRAGPAGPGPGERGGAALSGGSAGPRGAPRRWAASPGGGGGGGGGACSPRSPGGSRAGVRERPEPPPGRPASLRRELRSVGAPREREGGRVPARPGLASGDGARAAAGPGPRWVYPQRRGSRGRAAWRHPVLGAGGFQGCL